MTFLDYDRAKPLSINICSNQNVDVCSGKVGHLAEVPTCSAVGCENRTRSGVQFFRTPAGSQNRRCLWPQTLKRIDWNDATRLILISAMTASHPMLRTSILARLGMFVYNEVGHKSARSVIARLEKLFRGFPNFDSRVFLNNFQSSH